MLRNRLSDNPYPEPWLKPVNIDVFAVHFMMLFVQKCAGRHEFELVELTEMKLEETVRRLTLTSN